MKKCDECGGIHWRTAPCVPRKVSSVSVSVRSTDEGPQALPASTVHLPEEGLSTVRKNVPAIDGVSVAERVELEDSASSAKRPVDGNPDQEPKFDKKTWMREYMREHRRGIRRRAKIKADKAGS